MRKHKTPSQIDHEIKDFLRRNPEIEKALKVFEISHRQYEAALEGNICYYTTSTTHEGDHS